MSVRRLLRPRRRLALLPEGEGLHEGGHLRILGLALNRSLATAWDWLHLLAMLAWWDQGTNRASSNLRAHLRDHLSCVLLLGLLLRLDLLNDSGFNLCELLVREMVRVFFSRCVLPSIGSC